MAKVRWKPEDFTNTQQIEGSVTRAGPNINTLRVIYKKYMLVTWPSGTDKGQGNRAQVQKVMEELKE